MSEQWLSIVEYARVFNISDMTVRRRIRNGKLNAVLQDGKYFIPTTGAVAKDASSRRESPAPATPAGREGVIPPEAYYGPGHHSPQLNPGTGSQNRQITNASPSHQVGNFTGVSPAMSIGQEVPPIQLLQTQQIQKPSPSLGGRQIVHKGQVPIGLSGVIPAEVSNPINTEGNVSLGARNLLEFCDSMAVRLDKTENSIRKEYHAKIKSLETSLRMKDLEINQYKQQVEDLQILISIIDRK